METLSRLWMEGRSASQIADTIGNGVTRNAVIGKAHRLGLSYGEAIGSPAETGAPVDLASDRGDESAQEAPSEKAPSVANGRVASEKRRTAPRPSSVTISELTDDTCRWPVDEADSTGFRYCGAPAAGAAPYCVNHSKLAYQPVKPMRRAPERNALFPGLALIAPKS